MLCFLLADIFLVFFCLISCHFLVQLTLANCTQTWKKFKENSRFVKRKISCSCYVIRTHLQNWEIYCLIPASAGIAQWLQHPAQFKLIGFRIQIDSWPMLCFLLADIFLVFFCLISCHFLVQLMLANCTQTWKKFKENSRFVKRKVSCSCYVIRTHLQNWEIYYLIPASAGIAQWLQHPAQFKLSGFRIQIDFWPMLCFLPPDISLFCFAR